MLQSHGDSFVRPLKIKNYSVAAAFGVLRAHGGLKGDISHGRIAGIIIKTADNLQDVADAEEAVGVEELLLFVGGEVGRENAVRGAFSALVFACSAGLGGTDGAGSASGSGARGAAGRRGKVEAEVYGGDRAV